MARCQDGVIRISTARDPRPNAKGDLVPQIPERVPVKYNRDSELSRTVAPSSNRFDFALDASGPIEQIVSIEDD